LIDLLKKYFLGTQAADSDSTGATHQRKISVATCALLVEMANIDGDFSSEERDAIVNLMKYHHEISEEEAHAVIETAQAELEKSVDLWTFTNQINQHYSIEEKQEIVESLWRLTHTDGVADSHEEYLTRRVTNLLRLSHKDFIVAKLRAKRQR
jgi:uncharacterized tellurite resistance protein B-like protein